MSKYLSYHCGIEIALSFAIIANEISIYRIIVELKYF